jgi:hypothetical protein
MTFEFEVQAATGESRKTQGAGQWKVRERSLVLSNEGGVSYFPYEMKDNQLTLFFAGLGVDVILARSQG